MHIHETYYEYFFSRIFSHQNFFLQIDIHEPLIYVYATSTEILRKHFIQIRFRTNITTHLKIALGICTKDPIL
jgi:hypothetical protein